MAAAYIRSAVSDPVGDEIVKQLTKIKDAIGKKNGSVELGIIYLDMGYSGMTFDRPGMKRMLDDMKSGKVGLVYFEDISRIARDKGLLKDFENRAKKSSVVLVDCNSIGVEPVRLEMPKGLYI